MVDVLQAIKDVVSTYPPYVKAYLFGSRARGDNRPDSDWDVLLLFDNDKVTDEDFRKYSYPLDKLGWNIDAEINPVLFTRKRWDEASQQTMFYHHVMAERIPL